MVNKMAEVKVEITHIKTRKTFLRTKDIEKLIIKEMLLENEKWKIGKAITYKIEWQDETEGSPPYKIGVQCSVIITENMNYVEHNSNS